MEMQYRDKDSYLWSVLPNTGIVFGSPTSPKVVDFPNTLLQKTRCFGIPYEGNYVGNTTLRVMNFTSSTLKGPITSNGPVLYFFSGLAISHFKWKLHNAPQGTRIGFYTSSWLNGIQEENKYYLFPTDRGISIFNTACGEFYATGITVISVIVEGSFPLEMEVSYHNPKSLPAINLSLYLPQPYAEWCGELIMTQEFFNKDEGEILLKPVPKYFAETETRIAYLESTAVNLIFTDVIVPVLDKLGTTSTLIQSVQFKSLSITSLKSASGENLAFSQDVQDSGWMSGIFRDKTMAIKSITKPGVNIVPVVTISVVRSVTYNPNNAFEGVYLIGANIGVYGSLRGIVNIMDEYSIRNQLCSFIIPEYTVFISAGETHKRTTESTFTTTLTPNVETISFRIFGGNISRISGRVSLTDIAPATNIIVISIPFLRIDFYEVTA